MGKGIYIDRKQLKISLEKHLEMLKSDPVSRKILEEDEEQRKKFAEKLQEEK